MRSSIACLAGSWLALCLSGSVAAAQECRVGLKCDSRFYRAQIKARGLGPEFKVEALPAEPAPRRSGAIRFPEMRPQIVVGDPVGASDRETFPYVVALAPGSGSTICTGVMLDAQHVLTAAHCLCSGRNSTVIRFANFGLSVAGSGAYIGVIEQRAYPRPFDCPFPFDRPDLALLKLESPATRYVQRFPQLAAPPAQPTSAADIVGFGFSALNDPGSAGIKRRATVQIVSRQCADTSGNVSDRDRYDCNPGVELVAADPQALQPGRHPDTCNGDSGGGIFANLPVAGLVMPNLGRVPAGVPHLIGITSRGVKYDKEHCGHGGIYTLLTPAITEWLRSRGVAVVRRGG